MNGGKYWRLADCVELKAAALTLFTGIVACALLVAVTKSRAAAVGMAVMAAGLVVCMVARGFFVFAAIIKEGRS